MAQKNKRRLYRSKEDRVVAGIFGGIGEYFDIDSNLLRIIILFFLFITFLSALFPFLFVYLIAMFIIPSSRDKGPEENRDEKENIPCKPVYKKWWFWLIIIILLTPIVLVVLGFALFTVRTDITVVPPENREERIIIERPEDNFNELRIYHEE